MAKSDYIGRFAPSPTGMLHMGSLVTAMASYCDAKSHKGEWIVRIEDLDPPRENKGASNNILDCLEDYGFEFSQNITFQSHHHRQLAYDKAIVILSELGAIYYCACSRSELKTKSIENHTCRNIINKPNKPYSIKIKVPDIDISFKDQIQGTYIKNLLYDCGDFVIKRKDQLFAYQIAVVVDDDYQNISNIVRGIDLIESTPWQIYLNKLLGFKQATYAHLPILINSQGQKLSKQTFAKEIDNRNIIETLLTAYSYLNQKEFSTRPKNISAFWNHAINNWNLNKILKIESIEV